MTLSLGLSTEPKPPDITKSANCIVERRGEGYGRWFEVKKNFSDTAKKIHVVFGWADEVSVPSALQLAEDRDHFCTTEPANGFVCENSVGLHIYGITEEIRRRIDPAEILEEHFKAVGEHTRVIRTRP